MRASIALVAVATTLSVLALPGAAAGSGASKSRRHTATPRLSVSAAILVSPSTAQQLYGVRPDATVPIASTTKLMTALIVLEHTRLTKVFADPDYHPAAGDSQIGLVPGERMSVHDLLLALLLPSADDAAEDLAYNVGHRSVGRFISMMNRRARQLHLTHTHYSTPIGLDTPGNYSSASDLVKLAAYVLRTQPFFAHAVSLPAAVLRTGGHTRVVRNLNDLVARYRWINGVKTGHTLGAGYVLVASAKRDGMTLLSAVLGTASETARDQNTLALLDYGFTKFHLLTPIRAGEVLARRAVKDQSGKRAAVIAASGLTRVFPRGTPVRVRLDVPRQVAGPKARHAVVGTAVVLEGNRPVARIPVLLAHSLPAASGFTLAGHFVTRTSTLVTLLVLVCVAVAVAVFWRSRSADGRRRAERA